MTKKQKALNGKKFEGVLAEPIDMVSLGLIPGVHSQEEIDAYRERMNQQLFDARRAKIPDLARHFGLDPDNAAYQHGADGRVFLAEMTLMALAREVVPGFQEKKESKWSRARVFWAMQQIDAAKRACIFGSDLEACESLLKYERPELAKRSAKVELLAEAKQFQNHLGKMRKLIEQAEKTRKKELHEKPRLSIVK